MPAFGTLQGTFEIALNSTTSSNAAVLVSGSGVVQTGDLVFAVFAQQTNLTVSAVSDSMGHNYTATNLGTDAGSITGRAFYTRVTSNGTLTSVTAAATSSTLNCALVAASFAGPFSDPPVDANIANTTTGSAGAVYTCPASGVLSQNGELIIGWGARGNGTAVTAVSPNLLAEQLATQTVGLAFIGYNAVITTSSFAPVFTSASSANQSVLGTTTFEQFFDPRVLRTPNSFQYPRRAMPLEPANYRNTVCISLLAADRLMGQGIF